MQLQCSFVYLLVVFQSVFSFISGFECSRGQSRIVRDFVIHHIKPVYRSHSIEMPRSCPFHAERDIYHEHEAHKTEEGYGKWCCEYCGKTFYAETYLDNHLSNRHSNYLYVGPDAVCLADYCDIFRCDIVSGRADPSFWDTALCIEDDMTDLISKCNNAFSTCAPPDLSKNTTKVILNKTKSHVCSSLTCNKYWYTGKIEQSQWRMLLKTFCTVMLIGGMIVYYFVAYHHFYYTSKNTSNMATHLKWKHGIDIASKAAAKSPKDEPLEQGTSKPALNISPTPVSGRASFNGQLSIAQAFQTKLSAGSSRAKMITRSIALYLATEMRPFSTVDSKGFRNMVNCLEPKYTIPSRATFSQKEIGSLYDEVKQNLKSGLKLAQTVAITTDGWTSRATESFVTITTHFIDQSWKARENVLQTRPLHESHTGANIADVLKGAVQEWDLDRPHGFNPICTDGAANMAVAAQLAEMHPHIKCFAHTINLAAQQALKINEVQRLLGRIRKVVAFFHKSTTANHQLKLKQELLKLPSHKLIIDVKTRWNSAYDMVQRYLEQQVAILAALTAPEVHRDKDLDTLSPTDITNAEHLILILQPLKTITTVLCDTKQPTISMVFPLLLSLKGNMAVDPSDCNMIKHVKNAILSDLNKRYTDPSLRELMLQASFIDPRFKMLPFLDSLERISIQTSIISLTDSIYNSSAQHTVKVKIEPGEQPQHSQETDPPLPVLNSDAAVEVKPKDEPVAKKSALDCLFGDVFVTQVDPPSKSQVQLIEEEVSKYETAESVNVNENPLSWWLVHQFEYPFLSNVARHLLCIPATSVPSERVFSTAGDVVTAQRAALSPENVDKLVFLKKNISL